MRTAAAVLALGILGAAKPDPGAAFRAWIEARAADEKVFVLEWGALNLDADPAPERVAKICSESGLYLETWIFEDDDGTRFRLDFQPLYFEVAPDCARAADARKTARPAPAPWREGAKEFRAIEVLETPPAVRFGGSSMAESEILTVGIENGALTRLRRQAFGPNGLGSKPVDDTTPAPIGRRLVQPDDRLTTTAQIDRYIHWLVPDDGKVNGIAHTRLVELGDEASARIVQHVFTDPSFFGHAGPFDWARKRLGPPREAAGPDRAWLEGTQVNAAVVLAEQGYAKAIPALENAQTAATSEVTRRALGDSLARLRKLAPKSN